jgi:L-seryl-tRNA(Ser) seleniumtransferase
VQVGNVLQTFDWELEAAITPTTAAVLFFAGGHLGFGTLGLDEVIRIAHKANVPVVVDAAAQLPPKSNLWSFTGRGADLVIFSGGKELRGPQASGLIVGRQDLIDAVALHASPNQRLARAMKCGKEEMLGLLAAVELYLDQDEGEELAQCERIVAYWVDGFNAVAGLTAARDFPGTDGRPLPRAVVKFDAGTGTGSSQVQQALLSGEPSIAVAVCGPDGIYLNPELLRPGEEQGVFDRVSQIVRDGLAVR